VKRVGRRESARWWQAVRAAAVTAKYGNDSGYEARGSASACGREETDPCPSHTKDTARRRQREGGAIVQCRGSRIGY